MRFRLLGPLEVRTGDDWTPVRASKQRALLAILLLHPGRSLDRDWLIETLWQGQPPGSASRLLPHYVWRLRTLLPDGDDHLQATPAGYLLAASPDELDHTRFADLVREGRDAAQRGDVELAAQRLTSAIRLWRGPALADARLLPLLDAAARELEQSRVEAAEALAEAQLALGRHEDAVPSLEQLTRAEPYQERPWRLLMLALHRAGRRPAALQAYQRLWRTWTDELGIEPSQALRDLHQRLLADDPALAGEAPEDEPAGGDAPPQVVPAQLPPDLADFAGRAEEVAEVMRQLDTAPGVVVYGQGGVGKSALAVRVGHLLRARCPDGQLFVNLQAQSQPLRPDRVLAQFLRALGVSSSALPESLEERSRLFRSWLAERHMLVVLDNAADEKQVRPLLPPAGCAALVTSRRPLAGLEGFGRLRLGVLDPDCATELLGRIAGADRVRSEPVAARTIVDLCGTLPLAVRTAGARLSAKPHWPLARLAVRLSNERRRLDELRAGDLEVRATLALSYAGLSPGEQAALRAAALAPAEDFAAWPVAAALGGSESDAEELLERLVDAQLAEPAGIDVAGQARYRLHDLTRVFALERRDAEETAPQREAALRRLLEVCVALAAHAVAAAGDRVRGFDAALPDAARSGYPEVLELIARDPFAWYSAERAALVAAVEQGCAHGLAAPAWRLAHALATFFEVRGAWDEWRHTHETALAVVREDDAVASLLSGLGRLELDHGQNHAALERLRPAAELARQLNAPPLLTVTLHRLGEAQQLLGEREPALACHREALALAEAADDRVMQMEVLRSLGMLHQLTGDRTAAAAHLERALAVASERDKPCLRPWVLTALGAVRLESAQPAAAAECYREALAAAERYDDRRAVIHALRGLGDAYRQDGELPSAARVLRQALGLARQLGEDLGQAQALRRLGHVYSELDRAEEARHCLVRALGIVREVGHPHLEAEVLLTLGAARARAGRRQEAARDLRRSVTLFRELGFDGPLRRAERQLAALLGDEPG